MNNLKNLENFKAVTEQLATGLLMTVDSMRDKLTDEQKIEFDKNKAELTKAQAGLKDVGAMLSDLQSKTKF
jgi:hypothetical protein